MSNNTNKYGLSRHIDKETKLSIRQGCGFGCVICGMTIYTYEHIDPEFSEAKEHNPERMALLCGSCHLKITKGIWSKDKVKTARSNPHCLQTGFSNDFFDIGEPFGVSIGRIYYTRNDSGDLLQIGGRTVLSLKKEDNEPPKLSSVFCDNKGNVLFKIHDNEWIGSIDAWDIESVGKRLVIKDGKDSILLQIKASPPHIIAIEIANLLYGNNGLSSNKETGKITIQTDSGKHIDVSTGVIITEGPVVIEKGSVKFNNESNIMFGQDGMKMNSLNFEKFLLTGRFIST